MILEELLNLFAAQRPDRRILDEVFLTRLISTKPKDGVLAARLSVFTLEGEVLARWWSDDGSDPGSFFAPHALCLDSEGNIYVGEVAITSGALANCHTLRKFMRVR